MFLSDKPHLYKHLAEMLCDNSIAPKTKKALRISEI